MASPAGGLAAGAADYDVENIVISTTDPTWATSSTIAHDPTRLQNAKVITYCTGDTWTVTDVGTADVGGNVSPTGPAVPEAVRPDLDVVCTGS